MKNRRKARELSLQVLYQADVRNIPPTQALQIILTRYHFKSDVEVFCKTLVEGTERFASSINNLIKWYAKNWTLDRMTVIDRNILRFSIYELLMVKEVPPVVSINEGVEIAKRYGTEDSGKFINGILDKIRRERVSEENLNWGYFRQKLQNPLLEFFAEIKDDKKAYLVGGFIRDSLLGKQTKDIDIILEDSNFRLVEEFSRRHKRSPVTLDDNLRRVPLPDDYQVDFTLQTSSLEDDLSKRDFTINALALDLDRLETPCIDLIDLKGGLEDLTNRRISLVSNKAFDDDPLRMLRAFRFKAQFKFALDKTLVSLVGKKYKLISKVAKERITEEIFLIMRSSRAGKDLSSSAAKKLLGKITEAPVYPERLQYLEEVINSETKFSSSVKPELARHLEEEVGSVNRLQLLKLIVFFTCFPPRNDLTERMTRALALSKKQKKALQKVIALLPYLENLINKPFDLSQASGFFLEGAKQVPEACLALVAFKKGDNSVVGRVEKILSAFFERYSVILHSPKLVSGDELIRSLGVKPGPRLQTILDRIQRAQIAGQVRKKEEALALARHIVREE